MADMSHHHCSRPWYLRPPVWLLGALLLGLGAFAVAQIVARPAAIPYGVFFDQLDAGNVASVEFQGVQIEGRFKRAVAVSAAEGATPQLAFRSQVPELGDGALIPELRKQRVTFDAASSSSWSSSLGTPPWPMLLVGVVVLVAWMFGRRRGGGPKEIATDGIQNMPMMRLGSAIFGRRDQGAGDIVPASPPTS